MTLFLSGRGVARLDRPRSLPYFCALFMLSLDRVASGFLGGFDRLLSTRMGQVSFSNVLGRKATPVSPSHFFSANCGNSVFLYVD